MSTHARVETFFLLRSGCKTMDPRVARPIKRPNDSNANRHTRRESFWRIWLTAILFIKHRLMLLTFQSLHRPRLRLLLRSTFRQMWNWGAKRKMRTIKAMTTDYTSFDNHFSRESRGLYLATLGLFAAPLVWHEWVINPTKIERNCERRARSPHVNLF